MWRRELPMQRPEERYASPVKRVGQPPTSLAMCWPVRRLSGGTAASIGAAEAYGYYELNRAVIVPAGYGLGGGLVMSYGALSHLGAHTIWPRPDFAYLILSLRRAALGRLCGQGGSWARGTRSRAWHGVEPQRYAKPARRFIMCRFPMKK